jgi:hypothetical protein
MSEEYELPPGSDEALEEGCTCPVLDNPYMGVEGEYVISMDCPIHGEE